MTTVDWADVRRRVAVLAETPGATRVFGSPWHRYRLEPVLGPDELAELEWQLGVRLPDDYRGFLRYAGRGGAGPYYGVFPLRRSAAARWHWEGDGADLTDLDRLTEPFPTDRPAADEARLSRLLDERPVDDRLPEELSVTRDPCYEPDDAWWDRYEALLWDPNRTVGAICLCHIGRSLRQWLAVSGPERGTVWTDYRADEGGVTPRNLAGLDRITFAGWYVGWLTEAEAQAAGRTEGLAYTLWAHDA